MTQTVQRYYRGAMNRMPYVRDLVKRLRYHERFCPLDHFYSPIPSVEELRAREKELFETISPELPGIAMNAEKQRLLLRLFAAFHSELPFRDEPKEGVRYHYNNNFFGAADAVYLYSFLRYLRPKRVIEVGSGFSSCVMLDTVQRFLDPATRCTFIEPQPQRLAERMLPGDGGRVELIQGLVQNVDRAIFSQLQANDILFIDSSHVSKAGSDVHLLIFEVLPRLASGVYVHIHDIFYPFEYPKKWIYDGRSWNEAYLVRAFLQHNSDFEICCFASFLEQFAREDLARYLPTCLKSPGQSLWIKRR